MIFPLLDFSPGMEVPNSHLGFFGFTCYFNYTLRSCGASPTPEDSGRETNLGEGGWFFIFDGFCYSLGLSHCDPVQSGA